MTTAKDIAQKIRMMQTDDLGNALVRVGISVVSCRYRDSSALA